MKTKNLIIVGIALTIGTTALYFWLEGKKKSEQKKEPEQKPKTPDALLKKLIKDLLTINAWKNERDFLSILSKQFIKEAEDLSWIDHLPVSQESLSEVLIDLGFSEEYEKELEARYRK